MWPGYDSVAGYCESVEQGAKGKAMGDTNGAQVRGAAANPWMRIEEAVGYSTLSQSTLYNMMAAGQLAYTKVGRSRRISRESLDKLMTAGLVGAA